MARAARRDRGDRDRPGRADGREHARGARALRPPAAPRGDSFFNQSSADSTPGLEAIEEEIAPLFAAHHDAIYLDRAAVRPRRGAAGRRGLGALELEPDTAWLLHRTHTAFVRAGVGLDEAAQDRLRALNAEIIASRPRSAATCSRRRTRPAVLVTDEDELDGLAEDARAAAAKAARDRGHEQGWFLELVLPTQQAPLSCCATGRCASACSARRSAAVPRAASTTRVRRCSASPASAPSAPSCWATRTTPRTSRRTRPRRPPRPSPTSSSGSRPWPSPTRASRARTSPRRSSATTRAPRSSRGTGRSTPSRSRRSGARSTTPCCGRTSSSSGCSPTASSAPPTSSTG